MPDIRSNKLLPILGGLVLLVAGYVLFQALTSRDDTGSVVMNAVPKPEAPDADTPTETIQTLVAKVADLTHETQALRQDNEALLKKNERLLDERRHIEQTIDQRVRQQVSAKAGELRATVEPAKGLLSSLTRRVDQLSNTVTHYTRPTPQPASDIPVGLGLDGVGQAGQLVWHDPLDAPPADVPGAPRGGLLKTAAHPVIADRPRAREHGRRSDTAAAPVEPVYTVPENATLIGSTAFTALIGRIPIRGRVQDPWPFKVITGADNLTANGLKLPEVAGMVWSGTAVGDWTLGCVRGWVNSVTFVFRDGTIRTVSSGHTTRDTANQGVVDDQTLGWISDQWGTPCLAGKRISNATEFLAQRTALIAAEAAAQAAAASQTTTVTGAANGTITQSVGDNGPYILGKTIAGGVSEIDKWLRERQQQSFDAVFVRAGAQVAINISKEITVDYDPEGRKLRYARPTLHNRRTRLD